ncbi:hypothetical protein AALP_AA8G242400 [Arabis alpina]|uniref:DUF4283 domain-containing protein n=1 Tax=Arabis alpina TaxID=50452 RepID=A0A087G939_ARAAL|nr:hypothetical protein AALP_AA8G242400 [Arabis alpina]
MGKIKPPSKKQNPPKKSLDSLSSSELNVSSPDPLSDDGTRVSESTTPPFAPFVPPVAQDDLIEISSLTVLDLKSTSVKAVTSVGPEEHKMQLGLGSATIPVGVPTAPIFGTVKATSIAGPVLSDSKKIENDDIPPAPTKDSWSNLFKNTSKKLEKKGEAFTLPSGEACVKIPNSIIEKNRKAWDCFILGQFYSDPPTQGTIHNIVNGIWSRQYRDVTVSKMEGNAFLFRIPNTLTRDRVLNQRLWQIEGQTMFVAKWEPGVVPMKPELTSAPVWLELRQVPFQFFNEDGLERIASLVGDPKFLHPATANKTNLEVAKVFTLIDPRKLLPEAVNVQFDSGQISRVLVSSPWMPPVCEFCKEVGHNLKRCKTAPILCHSCGSTTHEPDNCSKVKSTAKANQQSRRLKAKQRNVPQVIHISEATPTDIASTSQDPPDLKAIDTSEKRNKGAITKLTATQKKRAEDGGCSHSQC